MNPRHKDQVGGFFKKVMAQGVSETLAILSNMD